MAQQPPAVDSISQKKASAYYSAVENVPVEMRKRMRNILLAVVSVPYIGFIGWCLFLMAIFPNTTGDFQGLFVPALASCGVVAVILLFAGAMMIKRVVRKGIPSKVRTMSVLRIIAFLLPGFLLCGIVPVLILREAPLNIQITDPTDASQMVAPLPVTFSLEHTLEILARRDLKPVTYSWDFDGDGQENDNTVVPETTAIYDRPGAYNVAVLLTLNDGTQRMVRRRVVIPKAVFSVLPLRPGVDESVRFSVAHLVEDPEMIKEVQWDFDGDDIVDIITDIPEAANTYLRTGKVTVSALVTFENQKQESYEREIEIYEPQPPPFPVIVISEPENLIGPAPFGTIFKVESDVAIKDVIWDFGDGEIAKGMRVGHNYSQRGVYQVVARIHSEDNEMAQLTEIVRVVETLKLSDLEYEGTPEYNYSEKQLRGEVPVTVNLTPRTTVPLVDFKWEAPGATSVGQTDTTLQAIYRRPGKYDIRLIAQDPDGKVLRETIQLIVESPKSMVSIRMEPEGGVAPLEVKFDASETVIPGEEITGFEWVFGDDATGLPQQHGALVQHLFQKPGTYTVALKTYTTSGQIYTDQKTIVIRAPTLDACALPSRTSGKAPLGVSFNMSCTTGNPTSVLWNFGDGAESDDSDPVHVFNKSGIYKVVLTIEDAIGTVSTELITITAE